MKFDFFDSHIHLRACSGGPIPDDEMLKGLKSYYRKGGVIQARTVFGNNTIEGIKFFDDVAHRLQKKDPDYIYPFVVPDIGGRANSPDFDEIEYVKSRFEEGFVGIGEVVALFGKEYIQQPPIKMRRMGPKGGLKISPHQGEMFDLAGKYGLPVAGHLWQELDDYKEFLRSHPDTNFIQCHANSRQLGTPDAWWKWAPEMFEGFKNFYIELFYLDSRKNAMEGLLNNDAIAVIKEYPERFMIGTDATIALNSILGMPIDDWIQYWNKILSKLPKESAEDIKTNNIKRLIKIL